MGKAGGGGEAAAVVILRVDLNELVAEIAQFDADGAMGGLDSFLFPAECAPFDTLHAEAEGGGFAEDKGGEDAVALVDVAGVELEVFLVGFVGNLAGFSLHFGEKGFLLVGIRMSHVGSPF